MAIASANPGVPSSGGDVVRGDGVIPGQGPGERMPTADQSKRGSLDDMAAHLRRKNEQEDERARNGGSRHAKPAETGRGHVGEFSKQLEKSQEAASRPGEERQKVGEKEAAEGAQEPEAQQIADPTDQEPIEGQEPPEKDAGKEETTSLKLSDEEALAKYRAWDDSALFPEDLEDKWLNEVTSHGVTKYVTQKELKQGYVRGQDWARMGEQTKAYEAQVKGLQAERDRHFQTIRDPRAFIDTFERNGYLPVLNQVREILNERDKQDRGMIQAAGLSMAARLGITDLRVAETHHDVIAAMKRTEESIMRLRNAEILERRTKIDAETFAAQQQQQQQSQQVNTLHKTYENQLNQLRPAAFRAYGIPNNKTTQQALARHLGWVINEVGFEGNITHKLVMKAAEGLSEELERQRRGEAALSGGPSNGNGGNMSPLEARARAQAAARAQALPPNRRGMGGGTSSPANGNVQRKSADDFAKFYHEQRMNRGY